MRDNVFDSIPYNTVSGEDNVFAHFLQTAGLYDFMEINKSNINDLVILLDGKVRISAYCKKCKAERVFTMEPYIYFAEDRSGCYSQKLSEEVLRIQRLYVSEDAQSSDESTSKENTRWQWKNWQIEDESRILVFKFVCSMNDKHYLDYIVSTEENKFRKIGQYPSVADLTFPELNEYKKVTLKYGDKDNWSSSKSESNPGITEFDCVIDGTTIHVKSDVKIEDGIEKCPKLTADVNSELDNSDGDHTERNDTTNTINAEKEKNYDHGLGDLISKWFGKNNNGNMNAGEIDCNQVIQGKLGDYLTKIFSIMKYLGIVLCVGMTIYDFVKALLNSDKEIMNKLVKTAFTRLILVAVLFFLPTFVNLIIKLFVDNPCEIKF